MATRPYHEKMRHAVESLKGMTLEERLQLMVKAGLLSQAEADERIAEMAARLKALEELAAQAQELDMGY